ncbi:MAG: FMN-binding protein [Bdellovibrionales bacterium]|nr:FMN-binding protein [Oligoflexia bacterium]
MSDEAAAHLMFPTLVMTSKIVALTSEQMAQIEKLSVQEVRDKTMKVFSAKSGEVVIIDRVLGKHEFITYAMGIDKENKVKQIEILEYKETYGHEIKRAEWRKQFYGKDKMAKLKRTDDIQNVSGATLSCKHVTDGVRQVLVSYDLIKTSI